MASLEVNVDKLMQGIREEVRRKRGQHGMNVSKVNPAAEVRFTIDTMAIDEALRNAETVHSVGLSLPPMTRQSGIRRKVAMLIARLFLRVAQIITRDQRVFNHSSLTALRALHNSLKVLDEGLAAARGEEATRVQGLEQRLAAVRDEVGTRVQALEYRLAATRDETGIRVQALEQRLAEVQQGAASRVQALEQGLAAARSCPYTFDGATRPSHVPLRGDETPQQPGAIISYAQNREDVLLHRVFPDRKTGFYIDVGAHDPEDCSVTKHFYDKGWHGINIEPLSEMFRRLCAARGCDINLNCGLSNREGILTLYESSRELGLSTFSSTQMETHRKAGFEFVERQCPVTTLANVCERYVRGEIDFISIDVEAHEREVIEGGDWKRWRPRVIVIEATKPYTNIPIHDLWEPLLLAEDYLFATFDGINRYYVRAEDRQLLPALSTPVNVLDRYIPYEYLRQIEEMKARIAAYESNASHKR